MRILGVNTLNGAHNARWCQIVNDSGWKYTCPVRNLNGTWCFRFKNAWHHVADYLSDNANVIITESGKMIAKSKKH